MKRAASPLENFSSDLARKWLSELASIRFFEENLAKIYPHGQVRCPIHLSIGHEAAAVGVCSALKAGDRAFGYHRSHHHYLAKGGSPLALLHELLGDERGCSGGRGGSTHLRDADAGFMGSTAIISGTLPVASGFAHSLKNSGTDNIVVAFCGDAAIEEGVFFETLNMATRWKLPLLIVIEDNDLSCYTDRSTRQSFASFASVARMFEVPFHEANGSEVWSVHEAATDLVSNIRKSSRPGVLHVPVFRAHEHCGPDQDNHLSYRAVEGQWPEMDPLSRLVENWIDEGKDPNSLVASARESIRTLFVDTLKERGFDANL